MINLDIDLHEFLDDVKEGISDEALQAKHRISGKKFFIIKAAAKEYLVKHGGIIPDSPPNVDPERLLADVRAGATNEQLMELYKLTSRQLQAIYRDMIGSGLASPMELSKRLSMTTSQVVDAFTGAGMRIPK